MKQIDVSTKKYPNTFVMVDDSDYEEISKLKWHTSGTKHNYAIRVVHIGDKARYIPMHTMIMGHIKGMEVDHINGNTLDNQRHNLRHCTPAENHRNRKLQINNTSGYKGVSWNKRLNKWQVNICVNYKGIYMGSFTCLIKAAQVYDKAAIKYHGEFAKLNFPI